MSAQLDNQTPLEDRVDMLERGHEALYQAARHLYAQTTELSQDLKRVEKQQERLIEAVKSQPELIGAQWRAIEMDPVVQAARAQALASALPAAFARRAENSLVESFRTSIRAMGKASKLIAVAALAALALKLYFFGAPMVDRVVAAWDALMGASPKGK